MGCPTGQAVHHPHQVGPRHRQMMKHEPWHEGRGQCHGRCTPQRQWNPSMCLLECHPSTTLWWRQERAMGKHHPTEKEKGSHGSPFPKTGHSLGRGGTSHENTGTLHGGMLPCATSHHTNTYPRKSSTELQRFPGGQANTLKHQHEATVMPHLTILTSSIVQGHGQSIFFVYAWLFAESTQIHHIGDQSCPR